jgi:hypothetical protein
VRVQLRSALPLAAAPLLAAPVHAGLDVEEQAAGVHYEVFTDSDDVRVSSQRGVWRMDLAHGGALALDLLREVVVVPGIAAAPGSQEAVDSISGASRPIATASDPYADWTKGRWQIDTSARWRGVSGGYYASSEEDYVGQQVSAGAERSLLGDNLVLGAGAAFGWDRIEPLEDADTAAPDDEKTTWHGNLVATWTATPLTMLQGGVEISEVSGLQHNPYRNVYVDGAWTSEVHPDARSRRDAFVKVSRYLPNRSSVKLDYKIYSDDWGIRSHTVGAKLNQYVGEAVVVRYRYRWYTQGAADFWRDEYLAPGGVGGYRTADYRMGDFEAHLFGTKVGWKLGRAPFSWEWLGDVGIEVEYERYFNSNNFSANIFETGLALSY